MYKTLLPLLLFFNFALFSQAPLSPVTWTIYYQDLPGNEGVISFKALIEPGWHIYSQRPTDVGPIPTSFSITPNANFELIGKVEETDAHEEFVAAFDAKVFILEKEAVFKQKIRRKNAGGYTILTSLEYMTCNDKQCLPPKVVELPVTVKAKK